jgi:hypothetical protein
MTTRERSLLYIVGGVVGTVVIGFVAYSFVISPYSEKTKQIKLRRDEVAALELEIEEVLILKKRYESARAQSLPADVGVSRQQYSNLLEGLCRRAEYSAGSYKILVQEPDNKSVPKLAPNRPAYTRLTFEMTVKGELYHLVDFMQSFYQQPLLHTIRKINIQRPSDNRAQGKKELDVTMSIEALVLDNAQPRATLLPIVREIALLSSVASFTAYNINATASGRGSPVTPANVMADLPREYLAIPGKDVFFGPPPPTPKKREEVFTAEDDISPFIALTSLVGYDDGSIIAGFRDLLHNNNYTITQTPTGGIAVKGEYDLNGKKRLLSGYSIEKPSRNIMYGTEEGQNQRSWRVRRVTLDGVILEKLETRDASEEEDVKPKVPALAGIAGGPGAFVAVPEGKIYKITLGQTLEKPKAYLLTREAWRDIFAPVYVPTAASDGK